MSYKFCSLSYYTYQHVRVIQAFFVQELLCVCVRVLFSQSESFRSISAPTPSNVRIAADLIRWVTLSFPFVVTCTMSYTHIYEALYRERKIMNKNSGGEKRGIWFTAPYSPNTRRQQHQHRNQRPNHSQQPRRRSTTPFTNTNVDTTPNPTLTPTPTLNTSIEHPIHQPDVHLHTYLLEGPLFYVHPSHSPIIRG